MPSALPLRAKGFLPYCLLAIESWHSVTIITHDTGQVIKQKRVLHSTVSCLPSCWLALINMPVKILELLHS
jgi:hypothetical protein